MSDPPSYPVWPYRHVRPSLLFEAERWAVVCEDMTEYNQARLGWNDACCECDLCREGHEIVPGIGYTLLQAINFGSKLEILGVFDGVEPDGTPARSPSSETGMVWARHYIVKGWIPVRYLLPMDIITDKQVQLRILRDSSVCDAVRVAALPFSPPVPRCRSQCSTKNPKDQELWETDSLGNFLLDLNEPDPEYHC